MLCDFKVLPHLALWALCKNKGVSDLSLDVKTKNSYCIKLFVNSGLTYEASSHCGKPLPGQADVVLWSLPKEPLHSLMPHLSHILESSKTVAVPHTHQKLANQSKAQHSLSLTSAPPTCSKTHSRANELFRTCLPVAQICPHLCHIYHVSHQCKALQFQL